MDDQNNVERRKEVSRYIYALWTENGSDEAGIAAALIDGRIDSLGHYVTFEDCLLDRVVSSDHDTGEEDVECSSSVGPKQEIEHRSCSDLPYREFFENYMLQNKPLIIHGLSNHWKASQEWVDNRGEPDVDKLASLFGTDEVSIHVQQHAGFSQSRPHMENWTVQDYAIWWKEHNNMGTNAQHEGGYDEKLLYLKDYTFVAKHPDYKAYDWPVYFQDDWLNEYTQSSYKFVYLGPMGTSTRLHADVLNSYSWSTNICGVKRWYLVPPEYTFLLYDVFFRQLASHLDCHDTTLYPGLPQARKVAIQVIQNPGETIFVPSGWHHTVENLAPTLSINHNWLNGTNIHWSWEKLKRELKGLGERRTAERQATIGGEQRVFNNGGSSQVVEDLFLLWMILTSKLKSILDCHQDAELESMTKFHVKACLPVLLEMQIHVQSSDNPRLKNIGSNEVDSFLKKL